MKPLKCYIVEREVKPGKWRPQFQDAELALKSARSVLAYTRQYYDGTFRLQPYLLIPVTVKPPLLLPATPRSK